MRFADLKNDFVFRKIFGHHPDVLAALLNDLLGLTGDELIDDLTYLPPTQAPEVALFKVSIVDVKCRQRSGRTFVVEMQLAHYTGFDKRVIYNTSKAYVQQLPQGGKYDDLSDVVGVSICNFEVFPTKERELRGQVPIPLVSRWKLTEQQSGASDGLPQLQLVFLELPKLRLEDVPLTGAAAWAWLFREARGFDAIPAGLPAGAYVRALELANEAMFSDEEREAYRHLQDELDVSLDLLGQVERAQRQAVQAQQRLEQAQQRLEQAQEQTQRQAEQAQRQVQTAEKQGLRMAIEDTCELLGIELSRERSARIAALSLAELAVWRTKIKATKTWPE